jgi:hypothetical protein
MWEKIVVYVKQWKYFLEMDKKEVFVYIILYICNYYQINGYFINNVMNYIILLVLPSKNNSEQY